jgi:ribonuclease BN (tRNA processing enzyme)
LYGPAGVSKFIDGLMHVFGPSGLQQPSYSICVHEVVEGHFSIGPYQFDSVSLPPAGNHGLRFEWKGKRYAITGDSNFHEQEIAFLKYVDLAIIDSGHIEDDEIVQLAAATQARTIVCSHLYREIDAPRLQVLAEKVGYAGTIIVGRDRMSFVL